MITLILVVAAIFLVVGLIWLVMQSGTKGNRVAQSGEGVAMKQEQNTPKPGAVRTSGSAND